MQLLVLLYKGLLLLVLIKLCDRHSPSTLFPGWLVKAIQLPDQYRHDGIHLVSTIALLIATVVISFQALKSAMMNPVKSLKSE